MYPLHLFKYLIDCWYSYLTNSFVNSSHVVLMEGKASFGILHAVNLNENLF